MDGYFCRKPTLSPSYLQELKITRMKNEPGIRQRRKFLKQSMSLVFAATAIPSFAGTWIGGNKEYPDFEKKPPLPPDMVSEFVRVAHFDLAKVKEMIEKEPMVVNA